MATGTQYLGESRRVASPYVTQQPRAEHAPALTLARRDSVSGLYGGASVPVTSVDLAYGWGWGVRAAVRDLARAGGPIVQRPCV